VPVTQNVIDFHNQVTAVLPKLRIQALALTRNRSAADDLVQDAVCNALTARESFTVGTNFAAWMSCILRNRFISNLRRCRDTTDIEDVPATALAISGGHEDRLALKELALAMNRLPSSQRDALTRVALDGASYESLAESTGCAVGTAKTRVFRARRQLEIWLHEAPVTSSSLPKSKTRRVAAVFANATHASAATAPLHA
jgi:RNA polymerase sigma-70 factor (ECF subfamily)